MLDVVVRVGFIQQDPLDPSSIQVQKGAGNRIVQDLALGLKRLLLAIQPDLRR